MNSIIYVESKQTKIGLICQYRQDVQVRVFVTIMHM